MSTLMVDCTSQNVPAVLRRFGQGQPVAGYVTGSGGIEWSELQFALFTRKIRIAQSADLLLDEESVARVLDVERWAAVPGDWPAWFESRTDKDRATCYCSLSSVLAVQEACDAAGIDPPGRWWLAWYWGRLVAPSVPQVLAALAAQPGHPTIPAGDLWAVQYAANAGGPWDLSQVFGTPDFSRR